MKIIRRAKSTPLSDTEKLMTAVSFAFSLVQHFVGDIRGSKLPKLLLPSFPEFQ